ncbi:MAG TPA: M15 family metallopeptidase [Candidatus Saccharimonadales bacterium]|nr:M15 family metallopeptidase [Candidatus Saccharimonadales bacterium]
MAERIVDSDLSLRGALADNPVNPCPEEIRSTLGLMEVVYWGFDAKEHIGQLVLAESVMADVDEFFKQALDMRFPIEKVVLASDPRYSWDDEKLMADNASSGFNYRLIAGTDRPSLHGRGLAFDINTRLNPYIRWERGKKIVRPTGAVWDKTKAGTLHADHPLVKLMEGFGWEWGGSWTKEGKGVIDYQHFEKHL